MLPTEAPRYIFILSKICCSFAFATVYVVNAILNLLTLYCPTIITSTRFKQIFHTFISSNGKLGHTSVFSHLFIISWGVLILSWLTYFLKEIFFLVEKKKLSWGPEYLIKLSIFTNSSHH